MDDRLSKSVWYDVAGPNLCTKADYISPRFHNSDSRPTYFVVYEYTR